MPIFRDRPPPTPEEIEAGTAYASARQAIFGRPLSALEHATRGQIIAFCIPYSHEDICNGGFHQYFSNGTGDYARVVVDGLRVLGDDARADLFIRAMGRFPDGIAPSTQSGRQAVLAKIDYRNDWRPWIEPIERAYYALGGDDLYARVRQWVDAHPGEFFLDD